MREGHEKRTDLYAPAAGIDRARRLAKGAPLAVGVRGRDQALGNMTNNDRVIAESKTKARAAGQPVFRRQY